MSGGDVVQATLRRLGAESAQSYPAESEVQQLGERARCAALREAIARVEAWLRDPKVSGEELLSQVRDRAQLATEKQRENRRDPELAGYRRGWWRATFLLAQALGLDPFGRTREQLTEQVIAGAWPWGPRRREYTGPTCAGVRKDGEPCGGRPLRDSDLCRHHRGQQLLAAPATVVDPEAELDRQVEAWLADFEQNHRENHRNTAENTRETLGKPRGNHEGT